MTRSRYRYTREGILIRLERTLSGWWRVTVLTDEGLTFAAFLDTGRDAWRLYRCGLARIMEAAA